MRSPDEIQTRINFDNRDKFWLDQWRNQNNIRQKLDFSDYRNSIEFLENREEWDSMRFAIRTEYGDQQLQQVPIIQRRG